MSSAAKAEISRQNSQASTGPKTEEGKQRSSLNATRHGFTGQTLILSPEEKEAYENHCIAYLEQYSPATHEETDLVQQYADLLWSLHQISVQQINVLSIIDAITVQLMAAGDLDALTAATAPHFKTLNTLAIYEQRRRRAAEATIARFTALAQAGREAREKDLTEAVRYYQANKAQDQPWNPADSGFVCSLAEIEKHLARQSAAAEVKKFFDDRKLSAK
jgi:hypothetical protein